jgi:hypothetical protein
VLESNNGGDMESALSAWRAERGQLPGLLPNADGVYADPEPVSDCSDCEWCLCGLGIPSRHGGDYIGMPSAAVKRHAEEVYLFC